MDAITAYNKTKEREKEITEEKFQRIITTIENRVNNAGFSAHFLYNDFGPYKELFIKRLKSLNYKVFEKPNMLTIEVSWLNAK